MSNPILEQLRVNNEPTTQQQQQTPTDVYINQLQQIARTIKNNPNSQMMIQNMITQNPNLKQAMSLIQSMRSPEQALIALAQQKGLNPTQIINFIKTL